MLVDHEDVIGLTCARRPTFWTRFLVLTRPFLTSHKLSRQSRTIARVTSHEPSRNSRTIQTSYRASHKLARESRTIAHFDKRALNKTQAGAPRRPEIKD
eukprot:scaffold7052_cov254-Pinguiococcus_pyrenoidosus.AAC.39